jgi:uncharacterized CHY-type Zn-finger protein
MHVIVKGVPSELAISTVSLTKSSSDDLLAFRCSSCSGMVTKYQGRVTKIYPFLEPSEDVVVAKQCKDCGKHYTFQTHQGYKNRAVKVILRVDKVGINRFYCHSDRNIVLTYSHDGIYDIAGKMLATPPFLTMCETCPIEYYIADIL